MIYEKPAVRTICAADLLSQLGPARATEGSGQKGGGHGGGHGWWWWRR